VLGGAAAAANVFAGGEARVFGAKPEETVSVAEATRAAENRDRATFKKPVVIALSGAAGQIAYSLLPLICSGKVFGDDTPVWLRLLDINPGLLSLRGVVMELEDAAYPLLDDVYVTSDYGEAFAGTDTVVLVGGFPRLKGMERKDLIEKNVVIFKVRAASVFCFRRRAARAACAAVLCARAVQQHPHDPQQKHPRCVWSLLQHLNWKHSTTSRFLNECLPISPSAPEHCGSADGPLRPAHRKWVRPCRSTRRPT
jgi:hypothetical protein